jgi:DNA-binding CsgD family transcriptional regulator
MEKNQSEALYIQYFNAVETVKKQNKLTKEEKLKQLLTPIVDLQDFTSASNREHKFAREDHINLNEELDLSALESKSEEWDILPNWKLEQLGILDTSDDIIYVDYTKFLPQRKSVAISPATSKVRTSLHELYKDWLPYLDQNRIQSKNLLDQALVCYTIKRAQNGDKQASDKLISLYIGRAASKETYNNVLKMLVSRGKNKNALQQITWPNKQGEEERDNYPKGKVYNYDVDDFQQNAKIYLAFIIMGFSPKSILDSMTREPESEFLHLPEGTVDVFLNYFGEYIPGLVEKYVKYLDDVQAALNDKTNPLNLIKLTESAADLLECFNMKEDASPINKMGAFLKDNAQLIQIDQVMEIWLLILPVIMKIPDAVAPYFDTFFDPYTPISTETIIKASGQKRASRILSYCYRPEEMGPRKNLTTWLFGGHGSYNLGKLHQMLADCYSRNEGDIDFVPLNDPSTLDSSDDDEEESGLRKQNINDLHAIREQIAQKASNFIDLQAIMKKANVTKEDLELLLDKSRGSTLEDLAEKYNLTEDQVRYKLKSIMNKLQNTTS